MLARISGGSAGIVEYLESGNKASSEFTRDDLDQRVTLLGDIALLQETIEGMDNPAGEDRYLHITLSFKESGLSQETIEAVTRDYVHLLTTAWHSDELIVYAEAHLPKIKNLVHYRTGELIERKPHVHIVIPKLNVANGQAANPVGYHELSEKHFDAIQEYINEKYGIESPRHNLRFKVNPKADQISRIKGDVFAGANADVKTALLERILTDPGISNLASFQDAIRTEYGADVDFRTRNSGNAERQYLNIKLPAGAKGINLREQFFTDRFLALPIEERVATFERQRLSSGTASGGASENRSAPRVSVYTAKDAQNLAEWQALRSREIRYVKSGNKNLYKAYKSLDRDSKLAMLETLEEKYHAKQGRQTNGQHYQPGRFEIPGRFREAGNDEHLFEGRDMYHLSRRALVHDATDTEGLEQESGRQGERANSRVLLQNHAPGGLSTGAAEDRGLFGPRPARGRREPGGLNDPADRVASSQEQDGKRADRPRVPTMVHQLHASIESAKERAADLSAADFSAALKRLRFSDIKPLLGKYGVDLDKYEVSRNRQGEDRVHCGPRRHSVSDFLTREMNLPWPEAKAILNKAAGLMVVAPGTAYINPLNKLPNEPGRPAASLWDSFLAEKNLRPTSELWQVQKASEIERIKPLRLKYHAERRALIEQQKKLPRNDAVSRAKVKNRLVPLTLNYLREKEALDRRIVLERGRLKLSQSNINKRFCEYLAAVANTGNAKALALLRQKTQQPSSTMGVPGVDAYEASMRRAAGNELAPGFADLAYAVKATGVVQYLLADKVVFTDTGRRVELEAETRSVRTLALRFAAEKFGGVLKVNGSDEFKRQTLAVAVAAELPGLRFEDPSLQAAYQAARAAHQGLQVQPAAPRQR